MFIELSMAMNLVSVKDKICFSTLTFMKDKLRKGF
jgi:hypothetical protein